MATKDSRDYIPLDAARLRQMENWEAENPPESGIVRIVRPTAAERVRARLAAAA